MPKKPTERCRSCEVVTVSDAELCARVQAGDRHAENEIVVRYTPLIRRLVARSKCPPQIDHDDLTQMGLLAVLRAARKFDPARGVKLITVIWGYAARDIQKEKERQLRGSLFLRQARPGDDQDDDPMGFTQPAPVNLPDGFALSLETLRPLARTVVTLAFGLEGEPLGIVGIARELNLRRSEAEAILNQALVTLGADPDRVIALPTSRPTSVRRRRARAAG